MGEDTFNTMAAISAGLAAGRDDRDRPAREEAAQLKQCEEKAAGLLKGLALLKDTPGSKFAFNQRAISGRLIIDTNIEGPRGQLHARVSPDGEIDLYDFGTPKNGKKGMCLMEVRRQDPTKDKNAALMLIAREAAKQGLIR